MESKNYILITGGAGYIGSHTVAGLIKGGYSPVIIDDFSNSKRFIIDQLEKLTGKRPDFEEGDCTDRDFLERIFSKYTFSGVIHFAAFKAVNESVNNPLKYYSNNIGSLVEVLQAMTRFNVKHFVFSSSCTVYGFPEGSSQVNEETPLGTPNSPYSWTKWMCEQIIRDTVAAHPEMSAVSLRYFNPVGADKSGLLGELPQGIPNNILPYITQTAIGKLEKLTVFGSDYPTRDGSCIRDFIHVSDLAEAHSAAFEFIKKQSGFSVFNLGTGKGTSVLELIKAFEQETGQKINWELGPRREGDIAEISAVVDKAKDQLGWVARRSIADAMRDSWNWEQKRTAYERD